MSNLFGYQPVFNTTYLDFQSTSIYIDGSTIATFILDAIGTALTNTPSLTSLTNTQAWHPCTNADA